MVLVSHFVWKHNFSYLTLILSIFIKAANDIEKSGMPFAKMDHLGYLTFCPSNLGTTMRASVHMKIPNTAALPHFKDICDQLQIQARGKTTQRENSFCITIMIVGVICCIFQNMQRKELRV